MPRTLLLDLDGTLVDTVPDLMAALNQILRARDLADLTAPQVTAMIGDGVARLVARAFAAFGREPDAAALPDFVALYESRVAVASQPYPGVRETLASLTGQGWTLAVCTNKPEHAARALLTQLDLMPMIGAVGGGDSFPVRKPDPAHLRATLALASGDPARAVMIGDHANDVHAAAAAAIPCIFAAWGYGRPEMAAGSTAQAASFAEAADQANRLIPA